MEEANPYIDALQLPIEVWNKVFAFLKPDCSEIERWHSEVDELVTQQAQLHQLRLVCTKFNKVIDQHPELLDQLLPGHMPWQSWPSLLRWLQRYRSHVRIVMPSSDADSQALLLGALACPSSQLTEVFLSESTEFTVGEDHMLCIPPNISSLSQLRRLLVAMETYNDDALDVSWTYGLTSLHSLDLHIEGEVTFSQDLTQLQQLTMLTVDATSWYGSIPDIPRMTRFEVNWKAMHNLQHIVLSGHMSFLDNVEEISLLKDLSLVSITEFEPRDCQTAVHLARLAYSLAAHKPQVQFTVKSCVVPVFSTPSSASD
ncbi:TPA: hypothetical protein ACH3X3_000205 [Trebouxia sp. C0006]